MQPVSATFNPPLRGWQRRALVQYLGTQPRDFLAVATPGSGKTSFALRIAAELLRYHTVEQVTVVVPTEHLKVQWRMLRQHTAFPLTQSSPTPIRRPHRSITA